MKNSYFITGFPGFVAGALLRGLLQEKPDTESIYLLVHPEKLEEAEQKTNDIAASLEFPRSRIEIVPGDITKTGLNIDPAHEKRITEQVTHVFHLAAVYDLSVSYHYAYSVNVTGTRMMNDWVKQLSRLKRYTYFSTAYIAGKREGNIFESQLNEQQYFKNNYEQTKFQGEFLVEKMMQGTVPVTIIRPGIIMGDSITGETDKFDGFYYLIKAMRNPTQAAFRGYTGSGEAEGNFVPIDYVVRASLYLAHEAKGENHTYHLTDPNPYKMKEIQRMLALEIHGKEPKRKVPISILRMLLSTGAIRRKLGIPKETLDYFEYKASFDTTRARKDLEGSGIECPDLKERIAPAVHYFEHHQDDSSKFPFLR
ncbi:thioester reductase-like protein [Sinobaca qinghaiensis]|uniref:Thioester reductase-like protein n=1 Tax=Sinobaca qinghaiensis TaxID=342944 RepID=A0A419V4K6_9BACL|nr:SDR family oxidoreductase [Sinobaca qinghaiensis]RKD73424.1 thioester reductase-like protein [Sinobaca qinghaiensis]